MYRTHTQCPSFRFRGSVSPGDDNALFLIISMVTGFHRTNNIWNSTVLSTCRQAKQTAQSCSVLNGL